MKISPEPGLPKRKVGLHEQITVEKEAFTQNSNFFFRELYQNHANNSLPCEWMGLSTTRKVLFVSELTLHLSDDDVLCKQTLAQAGSRRKNPEQTWWAHIWAIENNSQDLLTQIKEYKHSSMPHLSAVLHLCKQPVHEALYWRQTLTLSQWLWPTWICSMRRWYVSFS